MLCVFFFFSSRRRHTRYWRDWSSDVCSSDLGPGTPTPRLPARDLHDVVTTPPVRESPVDEVAVPREPMSRQARHERAALIAFVVFLVAAVPIVLFGVGSYHWFFRDDFFFVAGRKATSVDDLF